MGCSLETPGGIDSLFFMHISFLQHTFDIKFVLATVLYQSVFVLCSLLSV